MIARPRQRERGIALVTALFLITVLAALALVAVRLTVVQSHTVSLALQAARTLQAAQSGIEYGAYLALVGGSCGPTSLTYSEDGLAGIAVQVNCTASTHSEGGATTRVFSLQAFASFGAYGSPDYVSRRLQATVTDTT